MIFRKTGKSCLLLVLFVQNVFCGSFKFPMTAVVKTAIGNYSMATEKLGNSNRFVLQNPDHESIVEFMVRDEILEFLDYFANELSHNCEKHEVKASVPSMNNMLNSMIGMQVKNDPLPLIGVRTLGDSNNPEETSDEGSTGPSATTGSLDPTPSADVHDQTTTQNESAEKISLRADLKRHDSLLKNVIILRTPDHKIYSVRILPDNDHKFKARLAITSPTGSLIFVKLKSTDFNSIYSALAEALPHDEGQAKFVIDNFIPKERGMHRIGLRMMDEGGRRVMNHELRTRNLYQL